MRVLLKTPLHLDLTGKVTVDYSITIVKGGYGDVHKGDCPALGCNVAVKRLRIEAGRDTDKRNFARELNVWHRLSHPNVLPLLGYILEENRLSLVSAWMEKGSLRIVMGTLTVPEIFSMSVGIARGLYYLHSNGVIHADLKTDNVLVSPTGVPLLADFGISKLDPTSSSSPAFLSSGSGRGSYRWLAYEFVKFCDDEDEDANSTERPRHDEKTDVWAYGMTMLELVTGELPFAHIQYDLKVLVAIAMQKLPREPSYRGSPSCMTLGRYMWSVCKRCWIINPAGRPSMGVLLSEMEDYNKRLS